MKRVFNYFENKSVNNGTSEIKDCKDWRSITNFEDGTIKYTLKDGAEVLGKSPKGTFYKLIASNPHYVLETYDSGITLITERNNDGTENIPGGPYLMNQRVEELMIKDLKNRLYGLESDLLKTSLNIDSTIRSLKDLGYDTE